MAKDEGANSHRIIESNMIDLYVTALLAGIHKAPEHLSQSPLKRQFQPACGKTLNP
jgi:hypothetical protein